MLNFARQIYSFTIGFYAISFAEKVGVQNAWITLAMINFAFFPATYSALLQGAAWRKQMGDPKFHRDL